jgi:hypothetical protein
MLLIDDMPGGRVRQMELNLTYWNIKILFIGAIGDI